VVRVHPDVVAAGLVAAQGVLDRLVGVVGGVSVDGLARRVVEGMVGAAKVVDAAGVVGGVRDVVVQALLVSKGGVPGDAVRGDAVRGVVLRAVVDAGVRGAVRLLGDSVSGLELAVSVGAMAAQVTMAIDFSYVSGVIAAFEGSLFADGVWGRVWDRWQNLADAGRVAGLVPVPAEVPAFLARLVGSPRAAGLFAGVDAAMFTALAQALSAVSAEVVGVPVAASASGWRLVADRVWLPVAGWRLDDSRVGADDRTGTAGPVVVRHDEAGIVLRAVDGSVWADVVSGRGKSVVVVGELVLSISRIGVLAVTAHGADHRVELTAELRLGELVGATAGVPRVAVAALPESYTSNRVLPLVPADPRTGPRSRVDAGIPGGTVVPGLSALPPTGWPRLAGMAGSGESSVVAVHPTARIALYWREESGTVEFAELVSGPHYFGGSDYGLAVGDDGAVRMGVVERDGPVAEWPSVGHLSDSLIGEGIMAPTQRSAGKKPAVARVSLPRDAVLAPDARIGSMMRTSLHLLAAAVRELDPDAVLPDLAVPTATDVVTVVNAARAVRVGDAEDARGNEILLDPLALALVAPASGPERREVVNRLLVWGREEVLADLNGGSVLGRAPERSLLLQERFADVLQILGGGALPPDLFPRFVDKLESLEFDDAAYVAIPGRWRRAEAVVAGLTGSAPVGSGLSQLDTAVIAAIASDPRYMRGDPIISHVRVDMAMLLRTMTQAGAPAIPRAVWQQAARLGAPWREHGTYLWAVTPEDGIWIALQAWVWQAGLNPFNDAVTAVLSKTAEHVVSYADRLSPDLRAGFHEFTAATPVPLMSEDWTAFLLPLNEVEWRHVPLWDTVPRPVLADSLDAELELYRDRQQQVFGLLERLRIDALERGTERLIPRGTAAALQRVAGTRLNVGEMAAAHILGQLTRAPGGTPPPPGLNDDIWGEVAAHWGPDLLPGVVKDLRLDQGLWTGTKAANAVVGWLATQGFLTSRELNRPMAYLFAPGASSATGEISIQTSERVGRMTAVIEAMVRRLDLDPVSRRLTRVVSRAVAAVLLGEEPAPDRLSAKLVQTALDAGVLAAAAELARDRLTTRPIDLPDGQAGYEIAPGRLIHAPINWRAALSLAASERLDSLLPARAAELRDDARADLAGTVEALLSQREARSVLHPDQLARHLVDVFGQGQRDQLAAARVSEPHHLGDEAVLVLGLAGELVLPRGYGRGRDPARVPDVPALPSTGWQLLAGVGGSRGPSVVAIRPRLGARRPGSAGSRLEQWAVDAVVAELVRRASKAAHGGGLRGAAPAADLADLEVWARGRVGLALRPGGTADGLKSPRTLLRQLVTAYEQGMDREPLRELIRGVANAVGTGLPGGADLNRNPLDLLDDPELAALIARYGDPGLPGYVGGSVTPGARPGTSYGSTNLGVGDRRSWMAPPTDLASGSFGPLSQFGGSNVSERDVRRRRSVTGDAPMPGVSYGGTGGGFTPLSYGVPPSTPDVVDGLLADLARRRSPSVGGSASGAFLPSPAGALNRAAAAFSPSRTVSAAGYRGGTGGGLAPPAYAFTLDETDVELAGFWADPRLGIGTSSLAPSPFRVPTPVFRPPTRPASVAGPLVGTSAQGVAPPLTERDEGVAQDIFRVARREWFNQWVSINTDRVADARVAGALVAVKRLRIGHLREGDLVMREVLQAVGEAYADVLALTEYDRAAGNGYAQRQGGSRWFVPQLVSEQVTSNNRVQRANDSARPKDALPDFLRVYGVVLGVSRYVATKSAGQWPVIPDIDFHGSKFGASFHFRMEWWRVWGLVRANAEYQDAVRLQRESGVGWSGDGPPPVLIPYVPGVPGSHAYRAADLVALTVEVWRQLGRLPAQMAIGEMPAHVPNVVARLVGYRDDRSTMPDNGRVVLMRAVFQMMRSLHQENQLWSPRLPARERPTSEASVVVRFVDQNGDYIHLRVSNQWVWFAVQASKLIEAALPGWFHQAGVKRKDVEAQFLGEKGTALAADVGRVVLERYTPSNSSPRSVVARIADAMDDVRDRVAPTVLAVWRGRNRGFPLTNEFTVVTPDGRYSITVDWSRYGPGSAGGSGSRGVQVWRVEPVRDQWGVVVAAG
ncbi:MAG: hypothetical protein JWN95_3109, partial [Frankiales bacterium]|nr:hypothetical protein [Frankiales bacterium]